MIPVLIIYGLLATFELILILSFALRKSANSLTKKAYSPVSILVCARDEEENLARCLDALLLTEYDLSQVEILIGDDNSSDATWEITQQYVTGNTYVRGIKIQHQKDELIAKGNVLAQLVDEARFDKILIIDADMKVSKDWLVTMSGLLEEHDMISGMTMIDKDFYRPRTQFFDWAVVLHSMKSMADLWQPISILGNNMGFNRAAYDQVGGFRGLGPTDVEDLGLLRRFQKNGLSSYQYLGVEGKAYTKAQNGWTEMLNQRCRWMNGVFTHHWLLAIPAFFARLWFPIFLVLLALKEDLSFLIMLYGLVFNSIKYWQVTSKAKNRYHFGISIPPIISLLDTFALLSIAFKGKASWKGRKF